MPDALDFLEHWSSKAENVPVATAILEKLALESRDKTVQADLWVRLGCIKLTGTQDGAQALAAFQNAFECDPSRSEAASLAAELLLEQGNIAKLLRSRIDISRR